MLLWLRGLFRKRRVRVVIFGAHSREWMRALAPEAAVWEKTSEVGEVLQVQKANEIPARKNRKMRTVVIPLMEDHIASRPGDFRTLAPSDKALKTLRDKAVFADYVRSIGCEDRSPEIFRSIEEASFPCVIKRTNLNAGNGIEIVLSLEEAKEVLARKIFVRAPYIVQRFIPSLRQYAAYCVCKKGRVLWHCVYVYEHEEARVIRRSITAKFPKRVEMPSSFVSELETFLQPLEFSGPCNFDFLLDAQGKIVVFEINPRLGGSLMCEGSVEDLRAALRCIIQHARVERRDRRGKWGIVRSSRDGAI